MSLPDDHRSKELLTANAKDIPPETSKNDVQIYFRTNHLLTSENFVGIHTIGYIIELL